MDFKQHFINYHMRRAYRDSFDDYKKAYKGQKARKILVRLRLSGLCHERLLP
jgi:hypothetical protein